MKENSRVRRNALGGRLRAPVRIAARCAAAACLVAAVACSDDERSPAPARTVVAVTIAPDTVFVPAIGARFAVTVTARFDDTRESDVTLAPSTGYSSDDLGVAGFGSGVVSGAAAGSVRIAAEFGGVRDTALAIVDDAAPVTLDSLRTAPAELVLLIPETRELLAEAVWSNGARLEAAGLPFAYSTSDDRVARVSANGEVTAVSIGVATITVSYRGRTAEVPVSVFPERRVVFDRDVFPIMIGRCALPLCHPGAASTRAQRDLRLNSFENVMRGGANGPVVVPGDAASSRLFLALRGVLPGTRLMPLGEFLSNRELGVIEDWITQGACRSTADCPDIGGEHAYEELR